MSYGLRKLLHFSNVFRGVTGVSPGKYRKGESGGEKWSASFFCQWQRTPAIRRSSTGSPAALGLCKDGNPARRTAEEPVGNAIVNAGEESAPAEEPAPKNDAL
jgi:hypothetical protein